MPIVLPSVSGNVFQKNIHIIYSSCSFGRFLAIVNHGLQLLTGVTEPPLPPPSLSLKKKKNRVREVGVGAICVHQHKLHFVEASKR